MLPLQAAASHAGGAPSQELLDGSLRSLTTTGKPAMRVLLVHGPNLNRLGQRDPTIYGTLTLDEIVGTLREAGRSRDVEVVPFQSNHEGALIDWLQAEAPAADAIVINPGGLSHYSVALRDALEDTKRTVVEVHISDPSSREPFRHPLITATAATKLIAGKGLAGYLEALEFIAAPD
jgi:3-dehydroquinate dehydratase-2